MKHFSFILIMAALFSFITEAKAQQTSIVFTYDQGGSVIERKIQVTFSARLGHFGSSQDSIAAQHTDIKIYPNPTSQYLTIEGALPEKYKSAALTLVNAGGMILKTDSYAGQMKTLNLSGMKPGLYILEMTYSDKDKSTYKIIITN